MTTSEYYTNIHLPNRPQQAGSAVAAAFILGAGVAWWRGSRWTVGLVGAAAVARFAPGLIDRRGTFTPADGCGKLFPYVDTGETEERRTWAVMRAVVNPFAYPGTWMPTVDLDDPQLCQQFWIESPEWPGAKSTNLLNAYYYVSLNSKKLMVLSTPNGVQAAELETLALELAQRGFSVLVWDYPGFGYSQGSANYDSCIAGARRVREVAQELAGEKELWFYGWSMGGPHAAEMAYQVEGSKLMLDRTFASTGHFIWWIAPLAQWILPYNALESVKQMDKSRVVYHGGSQDQIFGLTQVSAFEPHAHIIQTDAEHGTWPPLGQMIQTLNHVSEEL